jgi:hypothetical protein
MKLKFNHLGIYSIEEGKNLRKFFKLSFGKNVHIKLRGRGCRIVVVKNTNHPLRVYRCDLPLKYAEKVAVYINEIQDWR